MRIIDITLAAAVLGIAGSASAEEPAGARQVPWAEYHLTAAKEANELAKEQSAVGDKKGAESTLDRSQADADLAVMLTREEQSRAATRKAAEQLNRLMQSKQADR